MSNLGVYLKISIKSKVQVFIRVSVSTDLVLLGFLRCFKVLVDIFVLTELILLHYNKYFNFLPTPGLFMVLVQYLNPYYILYRSMSLQEIVFE